MNGRQWLRWLVVLGCLVCLPAKSYALLETMSAVLQNTVSSAVSGSDMSVTSYNTALVEVTITGTAIVTFRGSGAGSAYTDIACVNITSTTGSTATTASVTGIYSCPIAGLSVFRVPVTTYSSGTVRVFTRLTTGGAGGGGGGGSGATGTATAIPPTYIEGSTNGFSFDLAGNARFMLGSCISGESVCIDTAPNSYLMINGGVVRSTTAMTGVTTNTTSSAFTIPTGSKTGIAQVSGTGAVTATVTLYGDNDNTAANGIAVCTIVLTATTKDVDKCTQFTEDYPFYYAVTTNVTGTGATVEFIIASGTAGSGTSTGGDASAANQVTEQGYVDGLEGGLGAAADAAATAGSTGSVTAKLRLMTSQLDTMSTAIAAIQTAVQLIDDDQTGASINYHTSVGVTEDETEIKATAGRMMGFLITNTNAAARYFRCANLTAANTTPGTSTVFFGIAVPGATTGAGIAAGSFGPSGVAFSTALTCWVVTGVADTDVAEVAANEIKWNIFFK